MDDTLRVFLFWLMMNSLNVLILVLMDDTLRDTKNILCYRYVTVLILVLMDDTLRVIICFVIENVLCLNPCFNG